MEPPPPPPPPTPQKCPRCDSSNTKFCYYNNYSLSQPRYFCRACRRYWTHGGTLRNVPVGGGCRRSKRPKPSTAASSDPPGRAQPPTAGMIRAPIMQPMGYNNGNNHPFYGGGPFLSSLAAGAGQYDANMALLQSLRSHHQPQNDLIFPSPQLILNMNPTRPPPLATWTQSFVRTSPGPSTGLWSRPAGNGDQYQAGLNSFDSNRAGADHPSR